MLFDRPVVCIDLETTGASPQQDRITEIGLIEISPDGSLQEWSTLINPQTRISDFIERLTGISNAMVVDAPRFEDIAEELQQRLQGRIFIAHNARFDYAFIKNAFKRMDVHFRADTLCTVRLSRRLYPQYFKHNLDSLIQRMGITTAARHRAMTDARVLVDFLAWIQRDHPLETLRDAIRLVMAKPALPPHLPEGLVDDIPDSPGVYLFYGDSHNGDQATGEQAMPLYVGKSNSLRGRVLSHFSGDHRSTKELRISQQIKHIEWHETAGELGALLLEARLVKALQPVHNQRLRRENDLCTWQMLTREDGHKTLALRYAAEIDFALTADLYGMFTSQRQAIEVLRNLADAHRLCLIQLGLEKPSRGRSTPCFGYQIKKCRGVCVGKEPALQHDLRLMEALAKLKVRTWPYPGAVAVRETFAGKQELHIIDRWSYLGTARDEADIEHILSGKADPVFDLDTFKILSRHLNGAAEVLPLSGSNLYAAGELDDAFCQDNHENH
ncbi:3'-5' exonuclease family protein [Methylobacillus flagellatus]|uniref:3'-5' exonuclease family protein n=1 Tax=Methylobacillus flagellatus TaxID=405 RepID=UPI0010F7853F|nr:3'-5' exonuclease family protein [Methylobacillus flagellatus]